MQLIQRSANGDYSKLLEITIENYYQERDNLEMVRGCAKTFVIAKQLCAFYSIPILSVHPAFDEEDWVIELRNKIANRRFSELQLAAYMSGAIDFMLEINETVEEQRKRFNAIQIPKEAAEFLLELWVIGFHQQRNRFGNQ